jgi:HicB-like protein involved in pilus formation
MLAEREALDSLRERIYRPQTEVEMGLSKKTTIRLSAELHERLSRLAEHRATSLGALVRQACEIQYGLVPVDARLEAVRELASLSLPVGDPEDLERESVPESNETAKRAWELVESGVASWKGGKPKGSRPSPRVKGKSASAIVLEDRR